MTSDIRTVLQGLPVQPLLDAITPDMWEDITIRQTYPGSSHADTECIFLRGPASFLNFFDTTAQDYPRLLALLPSLMPVMKPVLDTLECPVTGIGRVMLVKLRAHGHVRMHTDTGPYADAFQRHHVVLSSNDACSYHCGDTTIKPPHGGMPGECFWFDHHKPHYSHNHGSTPRVHLIVDTLDRRSATTDWSQLCPET